MRLDPAKNVTLLFNAIASDYDNKSLNRKKYNTAVDKLIIKYLRRQIKPLVLDAGCGTGSRTENLKSKISGSKFYCADSSLEMIKIAKKKKLDFVTQAEMEKLPFKTDYFDDVLCIFNSFGYLSSYKKRLATLKEFSRVLKPSGLLFIDVMNAWHLGEGREFKRSIRALIWDWLASLIHPALTVGDKLYTLEIGNRRVRSFVHGFTNKEMRNLMIKAGFRIDKFMVIGYNSGEPKSQFWQGQYFYVCKKTSKKIN